MRCGMVTDWKAVPVHDKDGRIVDIERGDEIECREPLSHMSGNDLALCPKCAAEWEAEGDLGPLTEIDPVLYAVYVVHSQ